MKKFPRASLRDADISISIYFLGYRVPWTVIHYWERRFDRDLIEYLVEYKYSVIDSTKFSLRNMNIIEVRLGENMMKDYIGSVGEVLFNALANWFGDRFKTTLGETSLTKIEARIIAYQPRIYMRIEDTYYT